MKKIVYIIVFIAVCNTCIKAQTESPANLVYTADSIVGGSSKDLFINFMQLSYNNLFSNNHEFNFSSNPYAVMLRSNPNLNRDDNYTKYKVLRKLNFSFGLKLDSTYKFNGFSSGIKYSLVDKRDFTVSKSVSKMLQKNTERKILHQKLNELRDGSNFKSTEDKVKFQEKINALFGADNTDIPLSSYSKGFQDTLKDIINSNHLDSIKKYFVEKDESLYRMNQRIVNDLKDQIKSAPLWTIGLSDTMYSDRPVFSSVVLVSEYSKGIGAINKGGNTFELNAKAGLNWTKDTTQIVDNLKRCLFNAEGGVNWVVRDHQAGISYFEFKFDNVLNELNKKT